MWANTNSQCERSIDVTFTKVASFNKIKKAKFLKTNTAKKRPNFLQKFVKIITLKVRISKNIERFAQIFPKQALKYTIFFNIKKSQEMAKTFNLRQNGNHDFYPLTSLTYSSVMQDDI